MAIGLGAAGRRGTRRGGRPAAAAVVAVLLAAACGGCGAAAELVENQPQVSQPTAATVVRAATLRAGQPVPVPAKPVLTLTGRVSAPNAGRTVVVDRATLERMGVVQVTVFEPWIKRDLDIRGIWLKDLLAIAGAAPGPAGIRITALDDYKVDLTATDVRAGGILLATSAGDGSPIPVADGGPTRIIFVGGVPAGANADQWIWSIRTIEVR